MHKKILTFALVCLLLAASPARAETPPPDQAAPLCLPGVYAGESPGCALLGPAVVLTQQAEMAAAPVTRAQRFVPLSDDYGQNIYNYVKLNPDEKRLIYPSLEKAMKREGDITSFTGGFSYATYDERVYGEDGKIYYKLTTGYWLRSSSTKGHVEPTKFKGVLLPLGTPERKFGWVLHNYETRSKPGYYKNFGTDNILPRYTMIEVFDEVTIDNYTYYMIAPDEWVIQTVVGLVYPSAEPPTGVENGKWIELNLFEQTMAVYENGEMVFATLTTSGSKRFFTRPGLFKITEKLEITHMQGGVEEDGSDRYYLMDVPWTMYFDERRALHGEYWHDHLGYPSSHGCANLSFADAEWMFNWAELGDWVYVWDPSGKTPIHEELFTQYLTE